MPNIFDDALTAAKTQPSGGSYSSPSGSSGNMFDDALRKTQSSSSENIFDKALSSGGTSSSAALKPASNPDEPWYEKAWSWANTPLSSSLFGLPEEREGAGGFERGVEHIISGLTSPLSVALGAATFGTGGLITSAGETALKEAVLESGEAAFSAADIAQIAKGSKAALTAYHSVPDIEPLIKGTLEVGGHDLGLLQKAREFFGPVSHDADLAKPEFQDILAKGGFDDAERKELARTGNAIKAVQESSDPVRQAVAKAGVDPDLWARGQKFLHDNKMDEAALLGGDAIDRGAFQILHHVAPDLSLGTTLTAARTAKTLMNTGFTLQQLEGAAAMSPRFFDALKEGDYDKAAEYGTEWAANAVLGVAGASHALHSWGELAEPVLGSKLKPSDQQLRVNNLAGTREAEHSVGDQQGIDAYKGIIRSLGYDPDKISGLSKAEKEQLAIDFRRLHLAIESGKDPEFASAYLAILMRAEGAVPPSPVNGLPTGTPITQEEIPPRANTKVVFQNDHGEVRVGSDGSPVVWMSPEAWSEFETSVGHKFSGVNYSKAQIDDVVSQLRAEHPLSGPIAELFKAAQGHGMPAAVRPGSGVLVVGEELHHALQRRQSSDGEIYNHLDGATKLPNGVIKIAPDSPWARLNGIIPEAVPGYMDALDYPKDPVTRVAETAAKFRAGRIPEGVAPEEVAKWLTEYEKEIEAKHGPGAYEPAERINEIAKQHLEDRDVREKRQVLRPTDLPDQQAGEGVDRRGSKGSGSDAGLGQEESGGVRGKTSEGLEAREKTQKNTTIAEGSGWLTDKGRWIPVMFGDHARVAAQENLAPKTTFSGGGRAYREQAVSNGNLRIESTPGELGIQVHDLPAQIKNVRNFLDRYVSRSENPHITIEDQDIFNSHNRNHPGKQGPIQAYGTKAAFRALNEALRIAEENAEEDRRYLEENGLYAREVEGEPFDVTSSNLYNLGGVTEAVKRLSSRTQKLAEKLSEDLSARLKIKSSGTGSIGHWEGGAEPSTFTEFPPGTDPDAIAYRMAIMAKAQRQNTGIHFDPNPKGPDVAFQFRVPSSVANPNEIARLLEEHHISGSTIKPIAGGHNVIIPSPGGELRAPVSELANRLKATEVKEHNGTQTTLGDWNDRNAASTLYDARIRELEATHPEWRKIRSEFESSPDYNTLSKLVREAEDKVKSDETASPFLAGVHGSRTANITELDPEFHGKGPQKGAEIANSKRFPEGVNPPKISFLNLEGTKREPFYERLPYQYRAVLNSENLYNWTQDRDNLLPKAEAEARAKKWDTIPGATRAVYQRLMQEAGYDGYYHPGHNQIGVFKNTPVEKALREGTHPFSPKPEPQTVGTAAGAKADTDFFAKAKTELGTDNISAIARRAQELKEAARPVNGLFSKERERENLAPTWYLKSNQLVDSRMQGPMPADTVLKMMENNGVKPDELKYTGLSDFLKEKGSEPVRPEELREYLKANNLQIKEVTKGGPYQTYGENGETKFESYTLPGANPGSYRELLMTLPSKETPQFFIAYKEGSTLGSGFPSREAALQELKKLGWNRDDIEVREGTGDRKTTTRNPGNFRSSHWPDEVNPVGHVRFNDRTGPNGEKLLHLEELQSDWHQKGRKGRYTDPQKPFGIPTSQEHFATREEAEAAADADKVPHRLINDERTSQRPEGAVPDAPFKKTWPEFLFKRMVRYAAENGYDGISWTPGEEQAARYDLSKQISEVHYSGTNLKAYNHSGDTVLNQTGVSPNDLPDIIGKEASQKLMAQEPKGTLRSLSGQDLKVGGEGMKGFYDKMVPEMANKLGKQFGAKVGETKIDLPRLTRTYGDFLYEGPTPSLDDLRNVAYDSESQAPVEIRKQAMDVYRAMRQGDSFGVAMSENGSPSLAEHFGGKMHDPKPETKSVPYFPVTDSLRESVLKQGQPLFAREGRPVNGLPENIEGMLQDNEFAKRSPEYRKGIIDDFSMIAEKRLPENILKAYKYATAEDGKNWEIANRNGQMEEFTDNHVHRKYLKNEQGNIVVSDAKAGKFATNTTGARRRSYDTLMTALLKSPDEIKFDPAEAISKDRAEVIKAAANRKFISQLMSSGLRASDGRPVAFLNGAGNVVAGENGKDPKTFVDPNRIRKINVDDKTIAHLTQSGDLQRFLDDGTIRDITPYVHPDNIGAAIDRLAKEALKSIDRNTYGEGGNNVLLSQIERLKEMQKTGDYSGLKELNDMQGKRYAWSPQGYVALDHNAMRGWNFVANSPDGNQVLVNTDVMAHPEYAEYLKNRLGLEKGALSKSTVGRAILSAGTAAKQTLLSLSPFHLVQIGLRGIMTGINPFTLEGPDIENGAKIDPSDPNSPTKQRKMVEQGLTTGRDFQSMQEYTEGLSSGNHSLLRRVPVVGKILADTMQWQTDFLFKRYLPAIKAAAAEKMFDDYQAKYPEWSVDKVARAAGQHANDSFGGVNWKAMGRNATSQEFARAILLAPDWLESELRSGARLFNKDEGAIGRRQVVIMAGSVYLLARVLNAVTTGNPHYEAPFSLATKSKDGKETLWGIRMLPSDLLHLASDPANFIKGRLSPGVGLTQEVLSGRDRMGRKMQPQDLWADAVRNLMPIPAQSIGQAITNTGPQVGNTGQAWKALGGTARTYATPAQQKAVELASTHTQDGFVDPVQQARHRAVMGLEDRLRSGDIAWPDLVKMTYGTSQLTEAELKKIQNNIKSTTGMPADIAHLYSRASRLPAKEFLDVWDTANITEQKALQPLLLKTEKAYLRKTAKDLTPEQRQQDPTFQRLLKMATGASSVSVSPQAQVILPLPAPTAPVVSSAAEYPFTATHASTGHRIGSHDGKTWYDHATGESLNA